MFKYIRIIFLGVTFLFCKSVNGKHIIKKTECNTVVRSKYGYKIAML